MHILFLTDNFPPEGNAPATRTYEHATEWVKSGHKVTVITTAPNFPEGKVFKGYSNSWYQTEIMNGIEVRRVKTYIAANSGLFRRILDYVSFMLTGSIAALFVKKYDVVVATSPQLFTALAGWIVSSLKRKPFVFELRDIWPASITAVGAMKKSFSIKLLEKLELFLYRQADCIISVTESFVQELVDRGIDGSKIEVVLNGVDLQLYAPQIKNTQLLSKWELEGKFVAGYIGTHGLAHGLLNIIDAAEILKENNDICFLFVGSGASLEQVKHEISKRGLSNVKVMGRQDKGLMPKIWSLCDVSLVHLKDTPLFKSVIPSKIFESMGMGLPIVISMPKGEATEIVTTNRAGVFVNPEQSKELALAILELHQNPEHLSEYSRHSLLAAEQFSRKSQAAKMLDVLSRYQ